MAAEIMRDRNVVTLKKNEGVYTVIYGNHFQTQSTLQFPENVGGLVFDGSSKAAILDPNAYIRRIKNSTHMRDAISYAEANKIPIIYAEAGFTPFYGRVLSYGADALVFASETVSGAALVVNEKNSILKKKISRGTFLKLLIGGWLLTPSFSLLGTLVCSQAKIMDEPSVNLRNVNYALHPEDTTTVGIRNAVIAFKMRFLMEEMGKRPNFVALLGTSHSEIERQIMASEEDILAYLQNRKPLINLVNDPLNFYSIAIYEFEENKWNQAKVLEVPKLKALVA